MALVLPLTAYACYSWENTDTVIVEYDVFLDQRGTQSTRLNGSSRRQDTVLKLTRRVPCPVDNPDIRMLPDRLAGDLVA